MNIASYNSVVFSSLSAVDYIVASVNQTDPVNDTFSLTYKEANRTAAFQSYYNSTYYWSDYPDVGGAVNVLWDLARNGTTDNLTTLECINKYATAFQTSRDTSCWLEKLVLTQNGKEYLSTVTLSRLRLGQAPTRTTGFAITTLMIPVFVELRYPRSGSMRAIGNHSIRVSNIA